MQRNRAKFITLLSLAIMLSIGPAGAALAAPLAPGHTRQLQTGPYAITNGTTYVRSGPGTGFYIVGTLYSEATVPISSISPDGNWWYVTASFGDGWVSGMDVTPYNAADVAVRDPGPVALVTTGLLNVRNGAGPTAPALGRLSRGQQVFVLAQNTDGTWLQIRWEYGTGWISSAYVSLTGVPAPAADGNGDSIPLTADTPYGVVLVAYLNVRDGPGINYAVLGQLSGGSEVPIVGRSADSQWYQVDTNFGEGWVYAEYLLPRNEYGTAPVNTPDSTDVDVAGPIGIINTGALNIRSGPGRQYTSVGVLAGGEQGQIIGRSADWSWWLMETSIGAGWASNYYVIERGDLSSVPYVQPGGTAAPAPGQTGGTAPEPALGNPTAVVTTGALNIRSGPNSAFESIGTVYSGDTMPVIGQSVDRGWWQVESPYGAGWVSKLYVVVDGDTSNVAVTQ